MLRFQDLTNPFLQLAIFRSALFENGQPMVDNFRPVLPLNYRQVSEPYDYAQAVRHPSLALSAKEPALMFFGHACDIELTLISTRIR